MTIQESIHVEEILLEASSYGIRNELLQALQLSTNKLQPSLTVQTVEYYFNRLLHSYGQNDNNNSGTGECLNSKTSPAWRSMDLA